MLGARVYDRFTNTAMVSGGGATEPSEYLGDNTSTSGATDVGNALIALPLVVR